MELAREHGVYAGAQALRLDYMGLKKRLGDVASRRPDKSKPVFVELIAPPPAKCEECLIEFESHAWRQNAHSLASQGDPGLDGATTRLARPDQ